MAWRGEIGKCSTQVERVDTLLISLEHIKLPQSGLQYVVGSNSNDQHIRSRCDPAI